jgi:hypothetical protein
MANQRFDVLATRKYKGNDGKEKTAFTRIGVAWANKDGKGMSVSLDCVPVPDQEDGRIRILIREPMPPKDGQRGGQSGGYDGGGSGEDHGDIPV